ncbi:MAG: patatin [Bacteroidetes bacterium]|nr:patatin [Rhodothermaceae bacterium RA]RMH69268.1 MAG: patatin [Bacteroidota bacterium]
MLDRVRSYVRRRFGPPSPPPLSALVLSGGGARAAYQAGVLHYIAEAFPGTNFPIQTGVSAGAINIAHLANHPGTFARAAGDLVANWEEITADHIFQSESSFHFLKRVVLGNGDGDEATDLLAHRHGFLDTSPLRAYLEATLSTVDGRLQGITDKIMRGDLKACAFVTTNYGTGQTVTWVQGEDITQWERPSRVSIQTTLTVDHIMASTALPIIFPAIRIGDAWYGDGGIRLTAPLSPAIHLGANRILAISTRYNRSRGEADQPVIHGYPPTAQIMGIMMNAIFLDMLDQDAVTLGRINQLLRRLPPRKWDGLKPIRLLLLRPSRDLGRLASGYELKITGALRLLTRGLGSDETKSPDWLSMLLFDREYMATLMNIGYEDGRRQHDVLEAFFDEDAPEAPLDESGALWLTKGSAQLVH